MTRRSVIQLMHDLESVLDRHRMESSLTYVEMVGALEFVKADLIEETQQEADEEEVGEKWD